VDMDAPLGSAAARGEVEQTAYSPLERALTRLEALAGILPACPPEHAEIYRWARADHRDPIAREEFWQSKKSSSLQ